MCTAQWLFPKFSLSVTVNTRFAWDNSVGIMWRESEPISISDNSAEITFSALQLRGSPWLVRWQPFLWGRQRLGTGCVWVRSSALPPSLCRAARGVPGRRISPCSHAPLAPELRLGGVAARETAGSKDRRSTFVYTRRVYYLSKLNHVTRCLCQFRILPFWTNSARQSESVLVWHFTSCGSCIFDAAVDILKTALFFCGAVAFVTFLPPFLWV